MQPQLLQALLNITDFSASSLPELLDLALDEVIHLSGSSYGYIYYYDEATEEFTLHAWSKGVMEECAVQNPQRVYQLHKTGIWGEVVRQRRPLMVNDFPAAHALKKGYPEGHVQLQRFLSVPVFSQGKIVAAVGVANKPTDYTPQDQEQLMQTMELFWQIAERFEEQEALQRLNRSYRALSETIRAKSAAQNEAELFQRLVDILREQCGYPFAWIGSCETDEDRSVRPLMVSDDGLKELLKIRVSWGDNTYGQGAVGQAVRSGRQVVLEPFIDNPQLAPWRDLAQQYDFSSVVAIPLRERKRVFGVLVVYRKGGETFHDQELQLLDEIGSELAAGIRLLREKASRKRVEGELQKLYTAIEQSPVSVMITNREGVIEYVNPHYSKLTGYSAAETLGRKPNFLKSGKTPEKTFEELWQTLLKGQPWEGEFVNRTKDGREFLEYARIAPVVDEQGTITHFIGVKEDITRRKNLEKTLARLAHYDQLTQLPNRSLFYDRARQAITLCERQGGRCALLFIDLNRFKPINDQFGHEVGDALLRACAERLVTAVRESDTVARVGGDEFIVLIPLLPAADNAGLLAEKLLALLCKPFQIKGQRCEIGASIGISIFPEHGRDVATLLRLADAAMYRIKEQGISGFAFAELPPTI